MESIVSVRNLNKVYRSGLQALADINLDIRRGEIFALLGPNGAGKTTLISIICGIVNPGPGEVTVDGNDIRRDFRATRSAIGLVPQELFNEGFETVLATVNFSRGLFGLPANPGHVEQVLRDLSLWDKRHTMTKALSGGMKRRVLIAKALAHEPRVLFLDEPTAGVDVDLRRGMWQMVRKLRERGVTIILTTHYIEEAEEMADRIGIINGGRIVLVEETAQLMKKLGKRELRLHLHQPLASLPDSLGGFDLALAANGYQLIYNFNSQDDNTGIADLIRRLDAAGIDYRDLESRESSLEEIFVNLVQGATP